MFIDTKAQFDPADTDHYGTLEMMLREMDRVGSRKMQIVPPRFRPSFALPICTTPNASRR